MFFDCAFVIAFSALEQPEVSMVIHRSVRSDVFCVSAGGETKDVELKPQKKKKQHNETQNITVW